MGKFTDFIGKIRGGKGSTPKKPGRGYFPGGRKKVDIDFEPTFNINMPSLGGIKVANDNTNTVTRSMGMLGRVGRGSGGPTGVMPDFRRESGSKVSSRDSVDKILATAANYLASIDASLRAQLQQQQYAYNQGQKQRREDEVEGKDSRSWLGMRAQNKAKQVGGAFKDAAWDIAKIALGVGGLYAALNFDELSKKFAELTQNIGFDLLGNIDTIIGLGSIGAAGYGWMKKRRAGRVSQGGGGSGGGVAAAGGPPMSAAERRAASRAAAKQAAIAETTAKRAGTFQSGTAAVGTLKSASSALGKLVKWGGAAAMVGTVVLEVLPSLLGLDPNGRAAAGFGILSNVTTGVGLGSFFGPAGMVAGGLLGLGYGLWDKGKQLITGTPPGITNTEVPRSAYEVVYANGDYGSPEGILKKSLSQMTIQEVMDFQRTVLAPNTKANSPDGLIHTPVGAYQFTHETLGELVKQGHAKTTDLFNAETQDRLAEVYWNQLRGGDMSKTWAYTFGSKPGQFANTSFSEVKSAIIGQEVGAYANMQPNAMKGPQSSIFQTYKSTKDTLSKLVTAAAPTNLAKFEKGATAAAAHGQSKFIQDRATAYERMMRGRDHINRQRISAATPTTRYQQAMSSSSHPGKVPNPSYSGGAWEAFAYFGVAPAYA